MYLLRDVSNYDNGIVGRRMTEKEEPFGNWKSTGYEVDIVTDDFGIVTFDEYHNDSFKMKYINPRNPPEWIPESADDPHEDYDFDYGIVAREVLEDIPYDRDGMHSCGTEVCLADNGNMEWWNEYYTYNSATDTFDVALKR